MTAADIEKAATPLNRVDPAAAVPIERGKAVPSFDRIGVPGYAITGGYILLKDTDARLSSEQRYRIFSENLVNVAIVGTAVRNFLDFVSSAAWTFKPADEESDEAAKIGEFFDDVFDDMETPIRRVAKRAAMYKFYGFSIQEWTAKPREDGRIGFADIEPRPQSTIERWDVDDRGAIRGMFQRAPSTGAQIYLPRKKLMYIVDDSLSDSPEGLGMFRHMVRTAQGLLRFEDLEHWGFETDLQGMPIGRAPLAELQKSVDSGAMTQAQAAQAKFVIENFITNHIRGPKLGIMLDSATYTTTDEKAAPSAQRLWDVELAKSGGTSHGDINEAIKRKTYELARLVGAEYLLMGADGSGSLAQHQSSTRRLHGMVNTALDEIADSINKQIVPVLATLNNIPRELWPKAKPEKVEYRTIEEVTGALAALATAGAPIMPDDPAINDVRNLIGLTPADLSRDALISRIEGGLEQIGRRSATAAPRGQGSSPGGRRGSGAKPVDPERILDDLRAYLSPAKEDVEKHRPGLLEMIARG
jgi:hypothetical protein